MLLLSLLNLLSRFVFKVIGNKVNNYMIITVLIISLQCFDAARWLMGMASGL